MKRKHNNIDKTIIRVVSVVAVLIIGTWVLLGTDEHGNFVNPFKRLWWWLTK